MTTTYLTIITSSASSVSTGLVNLIAASTGVLIQAAKLYPVPEGAKRATLDGLTSQVEAAIVKGGHSERSARRYRALALIQARHYMKNGGADFLGKLAALPPKEAVALIAADFKARKLLKAADFEPVTTQSDKAQPTFIEAFAKSFAKERPNMSEADVAALVAVVVKLGGLEAAKAAKAIGETLIAEAEKAAQATPMAEAA